MSYEGEPKYPQFGGSGSGSNQVGYPGGRPSFPSPSPSPSSPAYPTPGYPSGRPSTPGYPSGRPQQPFPTPNKPIPKPGGFPGNQVEFPSKPGVNQQYGSDGGYRY